MTIEELYGDFYKNFRNGSTLTRNSNNTEWTKNIYRYFYKQGVKNGFKVYANPDVIIEGETEYLVDLCWSKEDTVEYRDCKGLELVLESEWGTPKDAILWDFCKIVDMNAFLKIMVISIKEAEINSILKEMAEIIKGNRIQFKEENYLIIVFAPIHLTSDFEQYVIYGYKVSSEGMGQKLQSADFILKG